MVIIEIPPNEVTPAAAKCPCKKDPLPKAVDSQIRIKGGTPWPWRDQGRCIESSLCVNPIAIAVAILSTQPANHRAITEVK
jgi:hypothetical protein